MSKNHLPILYSFRRCPYAIRARLAIKVSDIEVELREVILSDKPDKMLACSPKGTVPVLQLADGIVIDESLDIMEWALKLQDPENCLPHNKNELTETNRLIDFNDNEFKQRLDRYKYSVRFPEQSREYYREQCEVFLQQLEDMLSANKYLLGNKISMADLAIFPFIRQFANVDNNWFYQTQHEKLQQWLEQMLALPLFNKVMDKYAQWTEDQDPLVF